MSFSTYHETNVTCLLIIFDIESIIFVGSSFTCEKEFNEILNSNNQLNVNSKKILVKAIKNKEQIKKLKIKYLQQNKI